MTENHDKRTPAFIIIRSDVPAASWFDSERVKVSAADLSDLKLDWFGAGGIGQRCQNFAADAGEGAAGRDYILQIRGRLVGTESVQTLRLFITKRAQQHSVNHAEDRRVGANAKRQSEYGHRGKARAFEQPTNRVPN